MEHLEQPFAASAGGVAAAPAAREQPKACARAAGEGLEREATQEEATPLAASEEQPAASARPCEETLAASPSASALSSCKSKRRFVIGGVVRQPAEASAPSPTPEGSSRPSSRLFATLPGSASRSRLSPSASTPALAMDLGEAAPGKSKWGAAGADKEQQQQALGAKLQRSPSLGALKVTKKQSLAPSLHASLLAGETSWEASWAKKEAATSKLPMGGGSVAFNLRMARIAVRQGPSWDGAF